ncbi:hypothetical protein ETAA8_37370 [Anatilimnocola aggregata]|uniref:Uncharacterized protein n=1 Tax=Anatilimnocola aggregata TaxID=2528021 RepID=A0A517YEH4_9BACT|nr:hypothetical protein [Anatilimnocola aggregata]QDU28634.1 hypothetical protein ETAA8_37370 [Anatilimnocola aggregata]
MSRTLLAFVAVVATSIAHTSLTAQETKPDNKRSEIPNYRVDATDFSASEADIRAVCDSAARQLWPLFADYELEPFVVTRGQSGPITLYKRNDRREIVVKLDTSNTLWSQYAYQFGHEFCHVLCGFREGDSSNRWFEETLSETASLYVLRGMARDWKDGPPYKHWASYRDNLREYADNVIRQRAHTREIYAKGMPAFYRDHEAQLRKTATDRELNGAMAVVLLSYFEEQPTRWEAIRWLNSLPPPAKESFADFLQRWQGAVPEKHRLFVADVAKLYGVHRD